MPPSQDIFLEEESRLLKSILPQPHGPPKRQHPLCTRTRFLIPRLPLNFLPVSEFPRSAMQVVFFALFFNDDGEGG